mmetsp:Transcript_53591/g.149063  ORF Transcript_53591/g.149063 Transcript_53591/m.149063 type:complete len:347 (-) Transcript_53591:49-1089(-)
MCAIGVPPLACQSDTWGGDIYAFIGESRPPLTLGRSFETPGEARTASTASTAEPGAFAPLRFIQRTWLDSKPQPVPPRRSCPEAGVVWGGDLQAFLFQAGEGEPTLASPRTTRNVVSAVLSWTRDRWSSAENYHALAADPETVTLSPNAATTGVAASSSASPNANSGTRHACTEEALGNADHGGVPTALVPACRSLVQGPSAEKVEPEVSWGGHLHAFIAERCGHPHRDTSGLVERVRIVPVARRFLHERLHATTGAECNGDLYTFLRDDVSGQSIALRMRQPQLLNTMRVAWSNLVPRRRADDETAGEPGDSSCEYRLMVGDALAPMPRAMRSCTDACSALSDCE